MGVVAEVNTVARAVGSGEAGVYACSGWAQASRTSNGNGQRISFRITSTFALYNSYLEHY